MSRLSNGDIDILRANALNAASFTVKGVDLNVVWRAGELPLMPGEWKFTWDTAFIDDFETCAPGTTGNTCIDTVNFNVGDTSVPAFKSQFDIDWTFADWEVTWRMRFVGAQAENCTTSGVPFTVYGPPCSNVISSASATNVLGATTYHNVQIAYHLSEWDTRVTFGVQNIGDKQPPISLQAFANSFDPTVYEVPGRFPYLRLSKTF